jgi:hypothetical protein
MRVLMRIFDPGGAASAGPAPASPWWFV